MIAAAQQPPTFNTKAFMWTIIVHLLLFLLFFLWQYSIPVLTTTDVGGGLEVNLGTSDNGSGKDQPMSKEDPSAYTSTVLYKEAPVKTILPKNFIESTNPDDPAINNKDKAKNTHGDADNKNNPHPQPLKYIYPGSNGKGGNQAQQNAPGNNEGNTTGPGDRGVLGGTPGAANYTGTPGSGGIGHTLVGRQITPDRFEAEFHEGGKVVIHVTVDRDGNIVNKFVKSSSSQQLTKLALDKLSKAKFSKSSGTEPQQFGDVTIVFKTR